MLSFYETGVLARRATRGAGYDWGLAEEATFAAGWLCDYGVDGADVLSRYLRRVDGQAVASRAVRSWPILWEGDEFEYPPLCPISVGAAFVRFWLGRAGWIRWLSQRSMHPYYYCLLSQIYPLRTARFGR